MRMPAGLMARLLFAAVLLTPPLAFAAQGVSDLDVTIRMIERQDPRIDKIINRIDPPAARIAMPPERGNAGQGRNDDRGSRAGSERSRDRSSGPGERRQQASELVGTARDARERRREAQEEARRDAREESRDGQRRFRDD